MLTLFLAASLVLQKPDTTQPKAAGGQASDKPQAKKADAEETPEGALRTFLGAMLDGDEVTLRRVTLPHEDFDVLLAAQPLSKLKAMIAKGMIASQPIKALKPGDEWTLPRGQAVKVTDEDVNDDHAWLMPEGQPIPFRCTKVDDHWRVDASSVIAGRKAARKMVEAKEKSKAAGVPLIVPGAFRIDSIGDGFAWQEVRSFEVKGIKGTTYACTKEGSTLRAVLTRESRAADSQAKRVATLKGHINGMIGTLRENGYTDLRGKQPSITPPIPDRVVSGLAATTPDGKKVFIGTATVFGKEIFSLQVIGDNEDEIDLARVLAESLKDDTANK
jgi:hypothetical protein